MSLLHSGEVFLDIIEHQFCLIQDSDALLFTKQHFTPVQVNADSRVYQVAKILISDLDRAVNIAQLVRALDLKTQGCGFDSQAGQPNNY